VKETIRMWEELLWSVVGMKAIGKDENGYWDYKWVPPEEDEKLKELDTTKHDIVLNKMEV